MEGTGRRERAGLAFLGLGNNEIMEGGGSRSLGDMPGR